MKEFKEKLKKSKNQNLYNEIDKLKNEIGIEYNKKVFVEEENRELKSLIAELKDTIRFIIN